MQDAPAFQGSRDQKPTCFFLAKTSIFTLSTCFPLFLSGKPKAQDNNESNLAANKQHQRVTMGSSAAKRRQRASTKGESRAVYLESDRDQWTLIVWKDYNCRDWKNIADGASETSSFTMAQKTLIRAEIDKMTNDGMTNDVWGTTFTMMDNLSQQMEFIYGGYSAIMAQDANGILTGRVCRVGDGFYNSFLELNRNPIISSSRKGRFYLFQTR